MSRFSNSVALARSSWGVLRTDKELVVIPIASFVVSSIVAVVFGGAVFFSFHKVSVASTAYSVTGSSASSTYTPTPLTYVVGAVGYLAIMFVVTFFTAALVASAYQRLTGGSPTLGSAFAAAWAKLPQIAGWSLLSGVVGLIIQSIESRGIIGRIVGNLLDVAWRLTTWLTIPVIMVEGPGPVDALKRSASLFKQTWGENVIAQAGFGIVGFLAILPGLVVGGLVTMVVPIVGIALIVLWVTVVSTVMSALNGIFRTALYMHASGRPVQWFDQQALEAAFRPKTGAFR
jgi:hypothetical protein